MEVAIKTGVSEMERVLRRQMADEIGEDVEVSREERLMLLQKFGLMAPRINRGVKKPHWMEVSVWKRKLNEFYQLTKGMVSQEFRPNPRRFVKTVAAVTPKSRAENPSLKRKLRTESRQTSSSRRNFYDN